MNRDNKMTKFRLLFMGTADNLLPNPDVDLNKWATLSADEKKCDKAYWEETAKNAGEAPSTVHLSYPDAFMMTDDEETQAARIKEIAKKSLEYFDTLYEEVTEKESDGFIYVKRETSNGTRKGVLMSLDLKAVGEDGLYRVGQAVCPKKVDVLAKVRQEATMELPHVIMFANDKDNSLFAHEKEYEEINLYDVNLNDNAGNVKGYELKGEKVYYVADAFKELSEKAEGPVLVSAYGEDYLMAAKQYYEYLVEQVGENFLKDHPLRYTLVEVVNMYDEAIKITPVHRVLAGATKATVEELVANIEGATLVDGEGQIKVMGKDFECGIQIGENYLNKLQAAIEKLGLEVKTPACVNCATKAAQNGDVALIMPEIEKDTFFETIAKFGPMPKNSFRIGKPEDMRYYVETRRIQM